jgi:hypothetical protein
MAVTVMNLSTGEKQLYTCSPKEAVIAAYAQSLGDYNTWDYNKKYNHLIRESPASLGISCGDFSAFKDGTEF